METLETFYSQSQRTLQREFDSERLAEAAFNVIVSEELDDRSASFVTSRDYFFLSTVNASGEPTVSYKGGPVGLVQVVNSKTLLFPNYDGNGMFYSMGNTMETGKLGMLFIDMETPMRLRVQGTGTVTRTAEILELCPGANMVVQIDIQSVFVNCGRYIHKHKRLETSKYVPDAAGKQPFPAWKRMDMLQDALPAKDSGKAQAQGGVISPEEYDALLKKGES